MAKIIASGMAVTSAASSQRLELAIPRASLIHLATWIPPQSPKGTEMRMVASPVIVIEISRIRLRAAMNDKGRASKVPTVVARRAINTVSIILSRVSIPF